MVAIPGADSGSAGHTMSMGMEALERLGATSPPRFLASSPDLARLARDAAAHLFSSLVPFAPKPLPLDRLLTSESFDAEQIWQQIDVQSRPLTRVLRRELSLFEKMEKRELEELFGVRKGTAPGRTEDGEEEHEEKGTEEYGEEEDDEDEDDDEEGDEDEDGGEEEDDHEKDVEDDGEEEDTAGPLESGGLNDGFFNTKELEKYMEEDEEREYGGKVKTASEEDDEEDDDDDQIDGEDVDDFAANARYEDFFVKKKDVRSGKGIKKKPAKSSRDIDVDDEWNMQHGSANEAEHPDEDDIKNGETSDNEADGTLSTFERELKKNQSKIEQIEKELLAPPSWTMRGEVTASKRPKNSALEVDLDFQHNKVPPAVNTEENTASIEELIIKRIRDGQFDDVQRLATLPTKESKEPKQLDDNKSQKGLAEIYEEEYVQKAGIPSATPSLTDEQKQQANALFKRLCQKLDALSHFQFTPKPVIEDMAIQSNVPALAMEEIAPLAVSDAAMLAPEEIFTGKGDIKEEKELTQTDRKRRRAKKKRKFKAESAKKASKKARQLTDTSVRA